MWYTIQNKTIDFRYSPITKFGVEAANLAVNNIMKNYKPPYYIMVSGGVDSQATLYAWKLFGKNFIPVSVIYDQNHKFNLNDLSTIIEFSKIHKIDVNFQFFDLLNFFETDYRKIANKFECSSPQISTHIAMSEKLNGTVIFSGTWLGPSTGFYDRVQHALTLYSFTRSCVPFFLMCHPDLAYTGFKFYSRPAGSSFQDLYNAKVNQYLAAGFPVLPQEKKLTGFELVKDYYDKHYWHLATPKMRFKYNNKTSKRTFDILLRYPLEEIFPQIDYEFVYNDC